MDVEFSSSRASPCCQPFDTGIQMSVYSGLRLAAVSHEMLLHHQLCQIRQCYWNFSRRLSRFPSGLRTTIRNSISLMSRTSVIVCEQSSRAWRYRRLVQHHESTISASDELCGGRGLSIHKATALVGALIHACSFGRLEILPRLHDT